MRPSTIITPLLLATVSAQSLTDALASASFFLSVGNSVLSSAADLFATNTQYAPYRPVLSQFTAQVWNSVTSEVGSLASAASTNARASSILDSVLSEVSPQFATLTSAFAAQASSATITGAPATSAASSFASSLSGASASISSALSSASASVSSANAASTRNAASTVEVGAMGAIGAAFLGLAAFL